MFLTFYGQQRNFYLKEGMNQILKEQKGLNKQDCVSQKSRAGTDKQTVR